MSELHRIIELPSPPGIVWERLWDVPALAACIPGCGDVEQVDERRRYRATIRERVGPFRIAVPLEILVEASPPERLAISASGRDATLGSPVKVALTVAVAGNDAGGTRLALDGHIQVAGKLATAGAPVIETIHGVGYRCA